MDKQDDIKHPAKFNDKFIPIFADLLKGKKNVFDPFAGTGKIARIKDFGFEGLVYCNEIEPEWVVSSKEKVDYWTSTDSETLQIYPDGFFESICTSPTYGNRMADSFVIPPKESNRKYITYTHMLGRKLNQNNTGSMQWGTRYKEKHEKIYKELYRILEHNGLLVLNIANHIRKGEEIKVAEWTKDILTQINFVFLNEIKIESKKMKFGSNRNLRVPYEIIFSFQKK
jgi:hypothetical protein